MLAFLQRRHRAWEESLRRRINRLTRVNSSLSLESFLDTAVERLDGQIQALAAERDQAAAVLQSMAEGVIALDADGRILLLNPAAAALFQVNQEEARGKPLLDVVRQHRLHELADEAAASKTSVSAEMTVFHPTEKLLRARAVPCSPSASVGPSVVLVIRDVTENQAYERLRKEFVANVSHELKTPLTSIRSLTETLLEGALEDPQHNRKFVTLIDDEAARLGRLIEDLLTLSQIESQGGEQTEVRPVALRPLVETLLPAFSAEVARNRLTLDLAVDPAMQVLAHPDRLKQVMINLIDNAVKYNRPSGSVRVSAAVEGPMVRVSVADTGIGIPAQDLPRIFERFYRVDKARSRDLGGTGLGLSIVKHIVDSHRGTVSVTSDPGRGSTFSFTLPSA